MLRHAHRRPLCFLALLVCLATGIVACQGQAPAEHDTAGEESLPPPEAEKSLPPPEASVVAPEAAISEVRASRIFAGPEQIPPADFPAYGIVAFTSRPFDAERERHQMLCRAYLAALPRPDELGVALEQQMVTVWPVDDDELADQLNATRDPSVCDDAIDHYALARGLAAIRAVDDRQVRETNRGPYLLAWAPGDAIGWVPDGGAIVDPSAPVLVVDLSDVSTAEQARATFILWRTDIEANPQLWQRGWDLERLRSWLQLAADRVGMQIFSLIGA